MKVLLSAFACEPDAGSEPGVGWNYARILSGEHEVTVLTEEHHKKNIIKRLKNKSFPNIEFIYIKGPLRELLFNRNKVLIYLYYYFWQIKACFFARKLCREKKYDIIHHVTYCVFRVPSFLFLLNVPFVWGPLGGGESAPLKFYRHKYFGFRGVVREYLRHISNIILAKDPIIRLCAAKSARILVTTPETKKRFSKRFENKIDIWPVNKLGSEVLELKKEIGENSEVHVTGTSNFEVLYAGQLLGWKGVHLAIIGFSEFVKKVPQARLTIIGEGKDGRILRKLVKEYTLEGLVRFIGWVDRKELFGYFNDASVFLFPSLHDSSPLVVAEAMLFSLPVICLNLGGPGLIVTEETGIKINPVSEEQVIKDISKALFTLYSNKDLRKIMSEKAERYALEYCQDNQIRTKLKELYDYAKRGYSVYS